MNNRLAASLAAVLTGACCAGSATGSAPQVTAPTAAHSAVSEDGVDDRDDAHEHHRHGDHDVRPGHGEHGDGHHEASASGQPPHDGPMVHRFDDAEKWAGVFDDPKRDAWQRPDEVVRALELSPGMTVADIGAGTGYFIGRLSRAVGEGGKVVATDIEPNLVDYMKKRAEREKLANVDVVQVGPSEAGLAPASVDRVLIVDVWHHIGNRSQYASQLAASLKRGGFVAIVDFTLESDHGPPRHHRLAPEAVIAELRAGGLEATVIDEALPDQYIVVGRIAQGK